jgi:hypothetical protein
MDCYNLCPEDENLQLQRRAQEQNKVSTCQYVDQARANGEGAPEVANKTTAVVSGTTTVELPKPKPRPRPPMSNTTATPKPTGTVTFDNEANVQLAAFSCLMLAICSAIFFF